MKCYYINFSTDGVYIYFDLIINDENDVLWMRLNGVTFNDSPSEEELINRCFEILGNIDSILVIQKIYLRNGDTCIYTNG
jgi:hypothetical protein